MKKLAKICVWTAAAGAVIGGISRLAVAPIILTSRAWAGFAVILLLFAIAIAQVYEN
jgi:hypothetical protein